MKFINKIQIGALLLMGVATSGCNGFLDIYNPTPPTTALYDTKDGQQTLIYDMFSRYRTIYANNHLQMLGTDMYMATDESPTSIQFNGYGKELSGLSPFIGSYWANLYKAVQSANILLNRCTPEIATGDYNRMMAQGRFFRVLSYYYLVETFGPVPLVLNENTDADNVITKVTREPEDKIYKFMIEELVGIKGLLPASPTTAGEVTDAAVSCLLGKLYLTRSYRTYADVEDADNAIKCFESIMGSKYYKLLTNFADVFSEDNQNNQEVIWAIQYGTDKNFNGGGNGRHTIVSMNLNGLHPKYFALNPKDFASAQRDIWANPIVHEWFRHPESDTRYDVTFKREFYITNRDNENYGKLAIYLPLWNDTSGDDKGAMNYYPFKDGSGNYNWYPAMGVMGWSTDHMPMCQKFKETKIEWGGKGTREDIVMRMADVYLLCAEAYLKKGDPDNAMILVNDILNRAVGYDDEAYELVKIDNVADMTIDRLLEERGCEMFGEHDRWFDLKRTQTLIDRAKLNPLVVHYNNISEKHMLRPIPNAERLKLEGLGQNDGYNN